MILGNNDIERTISLCTLFPDILITLEDDDLALGPEEGFLRVKFPGRKSVLVIELVPYIEVRDVRDLIWYKLDPLYRASLPDVQSDHTMGGS